MNSKELMDLAKAVRENAYAPYSGFAVGAALLCGDGTVYTGCNVENAAYSPTLCAERVAFGKAISEGKRDFTAIAVCGGKQGESLSLCTPCGVCRQVMAEFCKPDFAVYTTDGEEIFTHKLSEFLPMQFSL